MTKVFSEKNGWFKTPNRLVDGPLFRVLKPRGAQMLLLVLRKTQGYGQEWAPISYNQFARELGWGRSNVRKWIAFLQGYDYEGHKVWRSPFDPDNAPLLSRQVGEARGPIDSVRIEYAVNPRLDDESLRGNDTLEPLGRTELRSVENDGTNFVP